MNESDDLLDATLAAVEICSPLAATDHVIHEHDLDVRSFDVLAIGKCAGRMMDGACTGLMPSRILTIVPAGYPHSRYGVTMEGEHPLPGDGSFAAGLAAIEFVDHATRPVMLLLSGGGSACAEVAAEGVPRDQLLRIWNELLRSGLPITLINSVRRRLSAIKGGKLGSRMRSGSVVLIHSDVPDGRERDVASSPAFAESSDDVELEEAMRVLPADLAAIVSSPSREAPSVKHPWHLTGSSAMLIAHASRQLEIRGWSVETQRNDHLDENVESLSRRLVERVAQLPSGTVLVAGGEPRVEVRGGGRGGRCSELAVRLAVHSIGMNVPIRALVLATDGVDGTSRAAGVELFPESLADVSVSLLRDALERSDTSAVVDRLGRPVIMQPGGNNLRDVLLLARG